MYLNGPGLLMILLISCLCGVVLNGEYMGCDPLTMGRVTSKDQLLPLYVIDKLNAPGMPGFFVAFIFCGGLR